MVNDTVITSEVAEVIDDSINEVVEIINDVTDLVETTEIIDSLTNDNDINKVIETAFTDDVLGVDDNEEVVNKNLNETDNEIVEEEINETIEEVSETATENTLESNEEVKVENDIKSTYSVINGCFTAIKNLILKLYESVFNKDKNFKPTYDETINDLKAFLANKSAEMGVFGKFRNEFNCDETLLIGANRGGDYVPYAIKLTAFIDKQTGADCSKNLINNITKILLEFLNSKPNATQIVTGAMSAIYTYALSTGIKLL